MKIQRVAASDIDNLSLSPNHYIALHKQREMAYRRRLIRLYRCHYLPHRICEILGITGATFLRDIEELDRKGTFCLSYDARQEAEIMQMPPPSSLSKAQQNQLIEDNQFYLQQGIVASERCRLLLLTRSRLRSLDTIESPEPEVDKEARNQAIVDLFVSTKNKRGLKSKLAKTYNLSRKSIDLILTQHGVDVIVTSKHKTTASRSSKADSILTLYDEMKSNGYSDASLNMHIAQRLDCSYTYVHQTLKKHRT